MDYCKNGCPCEGFDCSMTLNSTDAVFGQKSLGILETGTESVLFKYIFPSELQCKIKF